MAQITDLDALEANAKQADRNGSAGRGGPPKPVFDDQSLREEILALIPRLTRYARALTHDISAADDLVQDCLARALEKIHLWEPGTDLRAWLFTILYRQHISHMRRDARQRERRSAEIVSSLVFPPDQTVRLELRDFERGLAKLPEDQRSLILLVGSEGMNAEAAAGVNIPLGTVRSRIARGRESCVRRPDSFPLAIPAGRIFRLSVDRPHRRPNHRRSSNEIVAPRRLGMPRGNPRWSAGARSWPDAPAARGKPQHVADRADEQSSARADATGLRHWAYGGQRELLQQNPSGLAARSRRSGRSSTATRRVSRERSHPAAAEGSRERSLDGSAGWDRLPAGIALRYIRVIACRIGAVVPGLAGVRLAVVVVVIIRIRAPPRIIIIRPRQSGTDQPPAVAAAVPAMIPVTPVPAGKAVVQAREAAVEPAAVKSTAVKPAAVKTAAMETAAVETAAVETAAVETAPPPPCAAWARSGWQRTAAPSNAAAMLTTRRLFLGRAALLPNSRIDNSLLHLAAQGHSDDPAGFMSGYVLLVPAAPITLGKFW